VVQVHYVSMVKTDRLEGDSSGADLKKSCSSLGCLGWVNVQRAWMTYLDESCGGLRNIWMQSWRWLGEAS
jgi:hypothetical protein